MRSLSDVLACRPQQRPLSRPYRREARFVRDLAAISTPLDRNQRAKLLHQAEMIERRSKGKGQRSGLLGLTGLEVLRKLVLHFANRQSGLCMPSYDALQEATGFCRQTIARAIRALEACGIIKVVRRLVRRVIDGVVRCGQGSNVYAFNLGGRVELSVPVRSGQSASFPKPAKLLALLVGVGRRAAASPPDRK